MMEYTKKPSGLVVPAEKPKTPTLRALETHTITDVISFLKALDKANLGLPCFCHRL